MMRYWFLLLFMIISGSLSAQSSFRKLSAPEKCWVLFHPFKAIKARKTTRAVMIVVDSVKQSGLIGVDGNGGKLDAFRHAYWMANLACSIGKKQSRKLGKAHEKGNYRQFRKHVLEDSALPDSVSCEMDLKNNDAGIKIAASDRFCLVYTDLKKEVLEALKNGELFIIRKDPSGTYLVYTDLKKEVL